MEVEVLGRVLGDADGRGGVDVVDQGGLGLAVQLADQLHAGDDAQKPVQAVEVAGRTVGGDERAAEAGALADLGGGRADVSTESGLVVGSDGTSYGGGC
ncbi:hypothetical protein ACFYYS_06905 [Streptomyces sp. NPDC002120]|uniref:hypothetical protein n=1 Tax=Streptomyces sp. NPDC002120 TaxID=3364631 RepID=UPI003673B95D